LSRCSHGVTTVCTTQRSHRIPSGQDRPLEVAAPNHIERCTVVDTDCGIVGSYRHRPYINRYRKRLRNGRVITLRVTSLYTDYKKFQTGVQNTWRPVETSVYRIRSVSDIVHHRSRCNGQMVIGKIQFDGSVTGSGV